MGYRVDITENQYRSGDYLAFEFTVDDGASTPAAVSLAGATVLWVLAARQGMAAVVSKTTTPTEINVTDEANGVLSVIINPADTADLSGMYWHELEITDSGGLVHTAAYGSFYIEADSA